MPQKFKKRKEIREEGLLLDKGCFRFSSPYSIMFIVQGDVYLRDGRLVCEVDTENTTQYLTSKLVADSIMWQQTFRFKDKIDRLIYIQINR